MVIPSFNHTVVNPGVRIWLMFCLRVLVGFDFPMPLVVYKSALMLIPKYG